MAPVSKSRFSASAKEKVLYIAIGMLIVLASIGAYFLAKSTTIAPPVEQGCTLEARICPDGSAVGRSGPMCEFDPCPPASEEQTGEEARVMADSGEYIKRLFDPTGTLIEDAPFPEEVREVPDSALVGLQCSGYYYNDGNGKFMIESQNGSEELKDAQLLDVVKKDTTISAISSCKTDTGATMIHYEIHAGGGGSGNAAYFFMVDESGALKPVTDILNDGAPYFGCRYPYMATRGNMWYWGCGGGDGGFGQASVYAIDVAKSAYRRVIKCTSTADSSAADPGGTSTVKCE